MGLRERAIELWVDVLGGALIVGWLLASIASISAGNGDFFQRLGAAGVAVAVFYFGLVRLSQRQPAPPSYYDRIHQMSQLISQNGKSAQLAVETGLTACMNTSILAATIQMDAEAQGRDVPSPIKQLALPVHELARDAKVPRDWQQEFGEIEERRELLTVKEKDSDKAVVATKRNAEIAQMVVVVVATLQWGFGDLLV